MHTVIVVAGGAALLLSCLLLGHAFGGSGHGVAWGAKVFIPVWLVASAINMWIGVSHAGYTVAQETPIFLGIFGVLAAVAAVIAWKWS